MERGWVGGGQPARSRPKPPVPRGRRPAPKPGRAARPWARPPTSLTPAPNCPKTCSKPRFKVSYKTAQTAQNPSQNPAQYTAQNSAHHRSKHRLKPLKTAEPPPNLPPQIIDLIVGGGRYASVEQAAEAAVVLNPLIPVDYHNDYGVEAIPETEDVRGGHSCFLRGGRPCPCFGGGLS